jgi:tetratricopeptide (TPR) repeat protein
MMYSQAEKEFTALAKLAPECAMTHWGIAMTLFHPLWPGQPNEDQLKKGWTAVEKAKSLNPKTEREQAYISAVGTFYQNWQTVSHKQRINSWEKAQEKLYQQYPDDTEAATLYALSHLATAAKADKTYSHQKESGALLEALYANNPKHPGVIHYTIHAYDNPVLANSAVEAARAYDQIAPDVPHALHMPTHIFVRLGIWPDVISWNKRSAKAALNYPANGAISHHYPHALDYLIYGHLQIGENDKAKQVLQAIGAHDNYQKTFVSGYALAAIPARYLLERKQWSEAATLDTRTPNTFPWEKFPEVEAITYFARGLGAARSGDAFAASDGIRTLDDLYERTVNADQTYWAILVDAQRKTVAAWLAYSQGSNDQAIQLMRQAADLEESVDKHPVTPGSVLPARELLGDLLVLLKKPAEAKVAYEKSLQIAPNRCNSFYGAERADPCNLVEVNSASTTSIQGSKLE